MFDKIATKFELHIADSSHDIELCSAIALLCILFHLSFVLFHTIECKGMQRKKHCSLIFIWPWLDKFFLRCMFLNLWTFLEVTNVTFFVANASICIECMQSFIDGDDDISGERKKRFCKLRCQFMLSYSHIHKQNRCTIANDHWTNINGFIMLTILNIKYVYFTYQWNAKYNNVVMAANCTLIWK